jgi:flagellar L-ring protein precursor FlgH
MSSRLSLGLCIAIALPAAGLAEAKDIYQPSGWPSLASDRRAGEVGDVLTVLVHQDAESVNSAQSTAGRSTSVGGGLSVGSISESGELSLGSTHRGGGELRRRERIAAQLTVTVQEVLPNGDLIVAGNQWLQVNGNRTNIGVRGRVRPADISSHNTVISARIADAMINFDGRGFVSRSAKPGLISRIFSFLGL